MARSLFVLLPPSEAKVHGGLRVARTGTFDEALLAPRKEVIEALGSLLDDDSAGLVSRTLKVRGPLFERALESSREIIEGRAPRMPAWRRYSGVVWSHLDPASLSPSQRHRLLVPSGLYGLTSGDDLVADYRLKMNVSLPLIGNVASFWRRSLTPVVEQFLEGATVVNLLPKEHQAAFDLVGLGERCDVVTIDFVDHYGERAAGHDAKAVKGVVARDILTGRLRSMASFRWRGWRAKSQDGELRIVAPRA